MGSKYKAHYLIPLQGTNYPRRLMFLDTESFQIGDRFRCELPFMLGWCCYINQMNRNKNNDEEWCLFACKNEMNEYIFSKVYEKTCLYVFGHNIFHDSQVLP